MPNANSLLANLSRDYPTFKFIAGPRFKFVSPHQIHLVPFAKSQFASTKTYPSREEAIQKHALLTLHELAHALLKHKDYTLDVERLKIESAAWEAVKPLCHKYHIAWDEDFVQDHLDTYRNWLHQKSLCKSCQLNRYQAKTGTYHCPKCEP